MSRKITEVKIDVAAERILASASPLPWRINEVLRQIIIKDSDGNDIVNLPIEKSPEEYKLDEMNALLIVASTAAIGDLVEVAGDCTYKDLATDAVCEVDHPNDRARWCGACIARNTLENFVQTIVDSRLPTAR